MLATDNIYLWTSDDVNAKINMNLENPGGGIYPPQPFVHFKSALLCWVKCLCWVLTFFGHTLI